MKRQVIASVIGVAGLVGMSLSSHGQGAIIFDNYGSVPYYPVTYTTVTANAPTGLAGTGALGNVDVELGYFLGTTANPANITLLSGSIGPINPLLAAAPGGSGGSTTPNSSSTATTGYFQRGSQNIPGYVSGPVTFEILAWVASGLGAGGGTFANSQYTGSLLWTEPAIAFTGPPTPTSPGTFTALPGQVVLSGVAVPEPTTLALAGLGGLASLVMLRRKHA